MFQSTCENCQIEFLALRSIDVYCSSLCREIGSAEKARRRTAEWRRANPQRAKQSVAEWREVNAERAKQGVKVWHMANPEKRRKHCADWRKAHAETVKKNKANWSKANPDKAVTYQQRRRAQKYANGGSFTIAEWQALKAHFDYRCLCCSRAEPEIKLTVDHIIPVTLGGSNYIVNIQPLCKICNLSKGTKTIDYRPK